MEDVFPSFRVVWTRCFRRETFSPSYVSASYRDLARFVRWTRAYPTLCGPLPPPVGKQTLSPPPRAWVERAELGKRGQWHHRAPPILDFSSWIRAGTGDFRFHGVVEGSPESSFVLRRIKWSVSWMSIGWQCNLLGEKEKEKNNRASAFFLFVDGVQIYDRCDKFFVTSVTRGNRLPETSLVIDTWLATSVGSNWSVLTRCQSDTLRHTKL